MAGVDPDAPPHEHLEGLLRSLEYYRDDDPTRRYGSLTSILVQSFLLSSHRSNSS